MKACAKHANVNQLKLHFEEEEIYFKLKISIYVISPCEY